MIRAFIFDFDGLIFDTETPDYETWAAIYRENGHALDHVRWLSGVGTRGGFSAADELAGLLGAPATPAALREQFQARYRAYCESAPLQPGVLALLEAAQAAGMPCAVASSSDRSWVQRWLTHHGIRHFFSCLRNADDVAQVKPAPDLFLSAAACLGVPPEECLVFEDSPNGMRAAAAAGIRCVAVPIAINAAAELPPVALRLRSLDEVTFESLLERLDSAAA